MKKGLPVTLNLQKKVNLQSDGAGFIQSLLALKFKHNRFYALDRIGAGIAVFDHRGRHVRTIQVAPEIGPERLLTELFVMDDGRIYVKDERLHAIFCLDRTGENLTTIYSPDQGRDSPTITLGGLSVVKTDSGDLIYTTIFNNLPRKEYLENSFLVAAFDHNGNPLFQFAKHSPIYSRYNLINFHVSTFTVWEDELYFLESASHKVRIYSLTGQLKRAFGEYGYHQRIPNKRLRPNATLEDVKSFIVEYSAFDGVYILSGMQAFKPYIIAVTYRNPRKVADGASGSDYFLMLYRSDGELLVNDIKLPGRIFDVVETDERALLLVNIDNNPTHRVVGFFTLEFGKK